MRKKDSQWLPIWTLSSYCFIYLHRLFPLLFDTGHSQLRGQQSLGPKQESQGTRGVLCTKAFLPPGPLEKGIDVVGLESWQKKEGKEDEK